MPEGAARSMGYTVVDLGDEWTPYIFAPQRSDSGEDLPNRYRRVFVGLANDRLDEDGSPLPPDQKNHLELYGIFPSMGVLSARFADDARHRCPEESAEDLAALQAVESIDYVAPDAIAADDAKTARIRRELESARKGAGLSAIEELARDPVQAARIKLVQKRAAEKAAMAAVEKRLACEGFLKTAGHRRGVYDDAMRNAVKRFQQKHMIYESHYLRRETMDALSRTLLENDRLSLLRALRERVVDAASVIEDGSVASLPNLADDLTKVAATALGFDTVDGAQAFFRKHPQAELTQLRVAIKLPPPPAQHEPAMDLSIVIDRGDVWYELPWDEKGASIPQPRKRYPQFTLRAKVAGKIVPLVHWRTTIGGWRADQASDGYEYFRYKGSDVGPRVIRQVVVGPVWIPPASTPIRSLLKTRQVHGHFEKIVNYDELGPGFLSAYGLVAGYFVVPGQDGRPDFDNGIRAHGSAEYLSMYSPTGFSHGCHRLPNHLAIRLYSFILRHRNVRVMGDQPADFSRQFLANDEAFDMRIPSRGYVFRLEPPLPVEVLEGTIKGKRKQPIEAYVPKPGTHYPGSPPPLPNGKDPEARAGGGDVEAKP